MATEIDWLKLKEGDYRGWRSLLRTETVAALTSLDRLELSRYNEIGYFHKIPRREHFEQMSRQWQQLQCVPPEWISKGHSPGIWTAMFSPYNTYSYSDPPILITRFRFKNGFYLFNPENLSHCDLWTSWNGKDKSNEWSKALNSQRLPLHIRVGMLGLPDHKEFYKENNFGAAICTFDYVCPVILLESSVKEYSVVSG